MTVVAESGPGAYRAEHAGPVAPVEIEVDPARSRLAVQSWYAGVHAATACPGGTLLTHRVHRVRPDHPGFAAGIAEIGLRDRMSRDLRQVQHGGWGFGTAVRTYRADYAPIGQFGWDGGSGASAYGDPENQITGFLLSQVGMTTPDSARVIHDFWTTAYQAADIRR
ncbi:hypothetical protein ACIA5D_27650 [Actinoplanes sp. NPDC051513]|uniref:hypothetical protein n=1 Tax=Actinoplanes sp. NPDC051513 TaxID=3363908 RepID=UPI00379FAD4C